MTDPALRKKILDIAENEYAIPEGIDPAAFLIELIPQLGSTDGEFRERFVYGTLHRWIASGKLPGNGLRRVHLALLEDDALFHGIGERDTDTAFLRAFAALSLAPSLHAHRQQAFLTVEDLARTAGALARYLSEEKDLRGYVSPEKWWAHGIAHAADAVGQLVRCRELPPDVLPGLLNGMARAMTPSTGVFAHEEDARMAAAVLHLCRRDDVSVERIREWLTKVVPDARYVGQLPDVHIRYVNARNFLRCLIFQTKEAEVAAPFADAFEQAHAALPDR